MNDYIATPLSREKIRKITLVLRQILGLENEIFFPVIEVLEIMPDIFGEEEFMFEIVPDGEFPESVQGDTDVMNHYMRIKESVYDGAYAGNGRDRYSIAHEIGHYVLMSVMGFGFRRNLKKCSIKPYEDPEWQADCFAGELLMPYHLIQEMSKEEIMQKCKVSFTAACNQSKYVLN